MNTCCFTGKVCNPGPEQVNNPKTGEYMKTIFTLVVRRDSAAKKQGGQVHDFVKFEAFGEAGKNIAQYVRPGQKLDVTSTYRNDEYTKGDGMRRFYAHFNVISWSYSLTRAEQEAFDQEMAETSRHKVDPETKSYPKKVESADISNAIERKIRNAAGSFKPEFPDANGQDLSNIEVPQNEHQTPDDFMDIPDIGELPFN